jgi:hypothetical protein
MKELIGKNVVIRTVTMFHVGRLESVDDGFAALDDAAWVADTGRWSEFLTTGEAREVEPFPGRCYISLGAVVDVCEWAHALLRTQS